MKTLNEISTFLDSKLRAYQVACAQHISECTSTSSSDLIKVQKELHEAVMQVILDSSRQIVLMSGKTEISSKEHPLQVLGERLSEFLDDDQWNEIEPLLLKAWQRRLDLVSAEVEEALGYVKHAAKFFKHEETGPWGCLACVFEKVEKALHFLKDQGVNGSIPPWQTPISGVSMPDDERIRWLAWWNRIRAPSYVFGVSDDTLHACKVASMAGWAARAAQDQGGEAERYLRQSTEPLTLEEGSVYHEFYHDAEGGIPGAYNANFYLWCIKKARAALEGKEGGGDGI